MPGALSAGEAYKLREGEPTVANLLQGAGYESGCYVKPAIVEAEPQMHIVQEETFAPILYLMIALSVISMAVCFERAWVFGTMTDDVESLARDLKTYLSTGDLLGAIQAERGRLRPLRRSASR